MRDDGIESSVFGMQVMCPLPISLNLLHSPLQGMYSLRNRRWLFSGHLVHIRFHS